MEAVRLARRMMATQFEILLYGKRETYLQTVGTEVLEEIGRVEEMLSFYRADSETRRVNVLAARQEVPVDPRFLELVEQARALSALTGGAFDITVAPLIRAWGFVGASGQMPSGPEIEAARALIGMKHVLVDRQNYTVRFDREGVMLDFGAIGKGYAITRAVDVLREYEIETCLLHGGTSTVYALGTPPEAAAWKIAIQRPFPTKETEESDYLTEIALRDEALSISAPHGKWFESEGRRYGHVLDPRTGYPTNRSLLAALVLPSATESDALSTALLTLGADWLPLLAKLRPEARAIVVSEDESGNLECRTHNVPGRVALCARRLSDADA